MGYRTMNRGSIMSENLRVEDAREVNFDSERHTEMGESHHQYNTSYISESNIPTSAGMSRFRDNFLMQKLSKSGSALRLTGAKEDPKLLENFSQTNREEISKAVEFEENEESEQESADSDTVSHQHQKIIPFSEFMKDKDIPSTSVSTKPPVTAKTPAPTKIPAPSRIPAPTKISLSEQKPVGSKATKLGAKSPNLKILNRLNTSDKSSPVSSKNNQTFASTLTKKGRYFESLKNKFSPLADINELKDKETKVIELGFKKRAHRQPNQLDHKQKLEEPLSGDGVHIVSTEDSK